jgi:hypothetical protein
MPTTDFTKMLKSMGLEVTPELLEQIHITQNTPKKSTQPTTKLCGRCPICDTLLYSTQPHLWYTIEDECVPTVCKKIYAHTSCEQFISRKYPNPFWNGSFIKYSETVIKKTRKELFTQYGV